MRLARPSRRGNLLSERSRRALERLIADPEMAARAASPAARATTARPVRSAQPTRVPAPDGPMPIFEQVGTCSPPLLPEATIARLQRIVREQGRLAPLLAAGVRPSSTVLLSGPPGVGKTHTARWLASELQLPLAHIEPAVVLSSLLGRSGQNLAALFEQALTQPCVVLVDEFDALAKRRDDATDIGELKRLVTVLLLELDRWPHGHLFLAATNHPHLLDPAVLRRFDHEIALDLPDQQTRKSLLTQAIDSRGISIEPTMLNALAVATDGDHGGVLIALGDDIARAVLVDESDPNQAASDAALRILTERHGADSALDALCWLLHEYGGLTLRDIARRLDTSHPTVRKRIDRFATARGE